MKCYECEEEIKLGADYIEFEDKCFHENCFDDYVWEQKTYKTNNEF